MIAELRGSGNFAAQSAVNVPWDEAIVPIHIQRHLRPDQGGEHILDSLPGQEPLRRRAPDCS